MAKEFLRMIRLDREELIGIVSEREDHILIHNPLKLFEFDNQIVLSPWIPFNCSPILKIDRSKIVFGPCDIIDELKDLYEKFNEYYTINKELKYGQYMCKEALIHIQKIIDAFKNQKEEEDKPHTPSFSSGSVSPEDLDKIMEEVFDKPDKDKMN